MFLNLWKHKSYQRYSVEINEYIKNLLPFLKRYCEERYDIAIGNVTASWPYFIPKSYEEIQTLDRNLTYFEKDIQIYVVYGLDLHPHSGDFTGYCEARRGKLVRPEDMIYAEMPAYSGKSPFVPTIYDYYTDFSRVITHELDHRLLAYLDSPQWISGPHSVPARADVKWVMPNGATFYSQRDPR